MVFTCHARHFFVNVSQRGMGSWARKKKTDGGDAMHFTSAGLFQCGTYRDIQFYTLGHSIRDHPQ